MQIYNNESRNTRLGKKIISEFLGFLKDKVDNDALTLEEEQAILDLIRNGLPVCGSAEDFARHFHQTPGAVRTVIHRKLLAKPKRRVLYPFLDFLRIAPDKWTE